MMGPWGPSVAGKALGACLQSGAPREGFRVRTGKALGGPWGAMGSPIYDGSLGSQRRREGSRVRAWKAVRRGKAVGFVPGRL